MEARQVRDLREAYTSIYAPQEEVEQLDEGLGGASIVKAAQRVIGSAAGTKAISNLGQKAREVVDYSRKGLAGASDELNRLQQSAQSSIDRLSAVTRGSAASAARGVERDVKKANKYGPQVAKQMSKPGATRIEKPAPTGSKPGLLKQDYEYDVFDVILEHLVTEGYADTNKEAFAIMANMSEEWKQSIVEKYSSSPLFNRPSNTIPGDSTSRGAVVKTPKPAQPRQPRNPNEGGPGSQNTRPRLTTGQEMRTTPTPRTVKTPR